MTAARTRRMTLDRYLVERQQRHPTATGELTRVITQIGVVAKIISSSMRRAALEGLRGVTGRTNVQGETQQTLDELGNSLFVEALEYVEIVCALVSEELERPKNLPSPEGRCKYIVLVDPIDGSSNLDVDGVVGSIFSIRRLEGTVEETILREGTEQIAAGYVMYGTATMLVYTAMDGVHSFVLDEEIGEFVLDHRSIRIPTGGGIVSANLANYGRWDPGVQRFARAFLEGQNGGRSLRYSGALVADLHQILHRGGIYLYPGDRDRPEGKLRLLYECAPLALIAEEAGGAATTGRGRVLEIRPKSVHQRTPFAVGSREEIRKFEQAAGRPGIPEPGRSQGPGP